MPPGALRPMHRSHLAGDARRERGHAHAAKRHQKLLDGDAGDMAEEDAHGQSSVTATLTVLQTPHLTRTFFVI
jgi:hypothetical protein